MGRPSGIVTLTTDYGTMDGYAGAVKGVVASLGKRVRVVDISHDIPPGDLAAGAWCLRVAAPCFPSGTVHLAVVDPGVGGSRRPVIVARGGALLVGPDNGLLSLVEGEMEGAWEIDPPLVAVGRVSRTFHGRDVFAPAAARLASGELPSRIGRSLDPASLSILPFDMGWNDGGTAAWGQVLHVDRFGNLVTSIPAVVLERAAGAGEAGGRPVLPPVQCYEAIPEGKAAFIEGSQGLVEISARGTSAARILEAGPGTSVRVTLCPGGRRE